MYGQNAVEELNAIMVDVEISKTDSVDNGISGLEVNPASSTGMYGKRTLN